MTNIINKISNWQDTRTPWGIMVIISAGLVVTSHSFLQNYLYMRPCEQCVYIRFAFLCMALGGILAGISPKNIILKLIAYALSFYGAILGIMYSLKLDKIHKAARGDDPFGVQGCLILPHYPFNLALHEWAPDWFLPTGDCGYDNPVVPDGAALDALQRYFIDIYSDGWYLMPSIKFMNMPQCTLLGFGVCFIVLAIMLACCIITKFKPAKA